MSFANFVQCRVNTAMGTTNAAITLKAAVAPFQQPPTDGGVLVFTDSMGSPSFVEVVKYTARSGNTLTGISRAQEGTTARAWPVDTFVYQSLTAAEFTAAIAKATEWTVQSANFTALPNSKNFITNGSTGTLPAIAGLAQGTTVVFGKALTATPVIRTTDGTQIKAAKATDTSFSYNVNADITVTLNGTAWEV